MSTSVNAEVQHSIDRAIGWLRATQDDQGRWLGINRGIDTTFYAIGLALDGESPDSPVVQDLCDYFESCATDEGGFGDYVGEPANAFGTCLVLPILKWARPNSDKITAAIAYLKRNGQIYNDPTILLSRWACQPELRPQVVADAGPPDWLRKIGLRISRKHSSERVPAQKMYPRRYLKPKLIDRFTMPTLIRALTFPPLDCLDEAAKLAPSPSGFDIMVLIHASLRRMAGDTTHGAERLYRFARQRRERFIFADGLYEWLSVLVADLFFTIGFGLEEERRNASRALRQISYKGNGWLDGDMVTAHVFDTALTVLALQAVGFPKQDVMMVRAVDYLKEARSPQHGMWAWGYTRGMADKRPYADTDDTGAACMALAQHGERPEDEILTTAAASLLKMQDDSGAFSLFDTVLRPNWCWVSNTSRSIHGLAACGLPTSHPDIVRGAQWLLSQQLPEGCWVDGWCTRYIYGTVTVLEGLLKLGFLITADKRTANAVDWLIKEQNSDGGWGENWSGGRSTSTCEHTGLAVYGLCLASTGDARALKAIETGMNWLIKNQRDDGSWASIYHMNFGFGVGMSDGQLPNVWAMHALGCGQRLLQQKLPAKAEAGSR